MASTSALRVLAADEHAVPKPFDGLAVRSTEPRHASLARRPFGRVHALRTSFLDAGTLQRLAAVGQARMTLNAPGDVEYAATTMQELATAVPSGLDLPQALADALMQTGALAPDPAWWQRCLATRIDFLASRGAGFHNDVDGHWSACLFWVLTLAAHDVEFVMPHAGLRLALAPGDLLLFDPSLAHGLCRPADQGQALPASFETGPGNDQVFLTGEVLLSDAQWAALGAPWVPVQAPELRGALDLLVAEFDERSGRFQRLHTLRHAMQRGLDLPLD